MVILSGLPGSGKSWFARRLASQIGATIVETDRVRRELFPVRTYSDPEHRAVRAEAQRRIEANLRTGWTVIYDATNLHEVTREALCLLGYACDSGVAIVQFVLPDSAIRANLARRSEGSDEHDASEAGIAIYEMLRAGLQRVRRPHWRCRSAADSERVAGELSALLAAVTESPFLSDDRST